MTHHAKRLITSTQEQPVNLDRVKIKGGGSILNCFMWFICEGWADEVCLSLCTSGFKNKQDEEIKYSTDTPTTKALLKCCQKPQIRML